MLKSAENWMAGFFGLEWYVNEQSLLKPHIDPDRTNNATIEVIIEAPGFNNSLAGGLGCPNAAKADYKAPVSNWVEKYLQDGMSPT
jgi:hypothetical protein